MSKYSVVGKPVRRIDGPDKVTGKAVYTYDMVLPGMLYGKILQSPYPHARILNIDTSKAEKLTGVKAVITGKDTPGIPYGNWRIYPVLMDELALAIDKVRYIGDGVAAVAAIDEDIAEEARDLIEVEYEELPAVFDVEEAMKDGAPQLHEGTKNNIKPRAVRQISYGDVEQGFKEADYVREDRIYLQAQSHAYMETHVAVASSDTAGRLTMWTSTQSPFFTQWVLARALGMREGDIRVIKPHVGGGFGGKFELFPNEVCAAILSKKTGMPVKIVYNREEEFSSSRRKHPIIFDMKTGVKKDGTLVARQVRGILDAGAYMGVSATVNFVTGFFHTVPYRIPNFLYNGYPVYTNKSVSGAMRGLGATQAIFASNSQLDMIAEDLGIDPLEMKLKNAIKPGDEIPGVAKIYSCGFSECLREVAKSTRWHEKRGKLPSGRGIGIAGYGFVSGGVFNWIKTIYPFSSAIIRLNWDGTAELFVGEADIGQGSDTVLCQIAAEELGIPMEDIKLTAADTSTTPVGLGAWSSRITLMGGHAVIRAAQDCKRQLFPQVAAKLGPDLIHVLEAKDGRVYVKLHPDKGVTFAEAVQLAQRANEGQPIIGRGSYTPAGKGLITPAFSFGAQAAEVEVDKETGKVKVLKVTTAHDCGQPINPQSVEGQLKGSIALGLGYALTEELVTDRGKVINPSFVDYKVPRVSEMPEMETMLVETYEPEGPYGAKEAGEGLAVPTPPAIRDAVYDAVGVWINDLPLTPEKVLKAMREKSQK